MTETEQRIEPQPSNWFRIIVIGSSHIRFLLYFTVLTLAAGASPPVDGKTVYAQYRQIIDDQTKTSADRDKQGQVFLRALGQADFLAFIRQVAQQPGYDDQKEGHVVAMVVFAKSYLMGPGRNEPLTNTLKQFSDPSLPAAWKSGLLDVLDLENRPDLSDEEVAAAISVLDELGKNKQNSDGFRSFCLGKLGSLLFSHRELLTQKAPELKDALEKQDRAALPKRHDANISQAAKLIDAIRDYRTALQKTADEVKDEKIKANLEKRLRKWEPASATP
jgi:hypothetical protein